MDQEQKAGSRGRQAAVATPAILAHTTGWLYVAGAVAVLFGALDRPDRSTTLFVVATIAGVTGGVVLRWGRLLPIRVLHVLVASGSLLITIAVVAAPSTFTALLLWGIYTFVAIDVFYYFARTPAVVQLAILLSCSTFALWQRETPPGAILASLTVLLAVSVVVGDLAARAARASSDPLTGLFNRRGMDGALEQEILEAGRAGSALCVALIDVDNFKKVNDAHGHAEGDTLLRGIAVDLRRNLPSSAFVGRTGGDEFTVLLPGLDGEDARVAMEEARRRVRHPLSVGVVEHLPGEQPGELVRRADAVLYEAKRAGRDRTVLGDARSTHLSRDLEAAVENSDDDSLFVVLQPVVAVHSGAVVAVEALARWNHPVRGSIPPGEFIPVAENAGLSGRLGTRILGRACREAAVLRRHRDLDLVLTVNASGRELVEPGYAERVLDVLEAEEWPATQLVVEVTESVVEAGSEQAIRALDRLRAAGIRVAIDDFGAGFSSFNRIDELPTDFLKIDRELLTSATTSARRRTLLESILGLAASLDLLAVAEGVETPEQAGLLAELGCPLAQGYHYARPARAAELLASTAVSWSSEKVAALHR